MEYKVIFHIDDLSRWNMVLKNTSNLLEAINTSNFNIEVLANGEAVKSYTTSNKTEINIRNIMKNLSDRGVKFVACYNTLKSLNIKEDDLNTFVHIVPVGILELVSKQMDGYIYIKP